MQETAAERYLRLGLRLGRHVDGIVDSYYGPPEIASDVDAEEPVDPCALAGDADALLDGLEDGWLRDQVLGARAYAGVLTGEERSYADEVEACYGVRPTHADESVFEAAHQRLAELLPGDGPIAERYERWRTSMLVPVEAIERTAAAAIEEARAQARRLVDLPLDEGVSLGLVRDEPWWAFCAYEGGLRSRIEVNTSLPLSAVELLHLTIHETYPGHHTESCVKEQLLVREQGLLEQTLVLVPTGQSVVSEGIAEVAVELLLEGDGGAALAAVIHRAGIDLDLEHALAVERAREPCGWADVNAALMLNAGEASADEAQAYLERWGLMRPEFAEHVVRFVNDPSSRTYVMNYSAGRELCRAYVGGDPSRFRRLLTEQMRVRDLVEARDAAA